MTFIIRAMNLRRLDLNLLVVFDALMTDRNVTRAAERVGLSQPAMSNALSRLRAFFKDDLFVRSPEGMRPTPRAIEIAPNIHAALGAIDASLDPVRFTPAEARRVFRLDTNDYVVTTYFPKLLSILAKEAPGIDIRIFPQTGHTFERLDAQEIDFGISAYGELPDRFAREDLDEDVYVVIMRKTHPLAEQILTLNRYVAATHLLVSPRGDPRGFVDSALAERGLTRRIVLTVNQFSAAAPVVAMTDLMVTIPKRIADAFGPAFGLIQKPSPIPGPRAFSAISMIWHRRLGEHPAHTWFRHALKRAVSRR
jgi:DNA-binding transcriptional LysR family regulator